MLANFVADEHDAARGAASAATQSTPHLVIAVPGLTIPWAHAAYLWIAAAVSLTVHEVNGLNHPALHLACPANAVGPERSKQQGCTRCGLSVPASLVSMVFECAQSGHALAAAAEGVTLHHIAFFLALGVPGAYVSMDSEGLAALTPWRVLRVRLTFFE